MTGPKPGSLDDTAFRWRLWTRSFGYALMPSKAELDALLLARQALGVRLWNEQFRPVLAPRFPQLFDPAPLPSDRRLIGDFLRVASSAHLLATSLCALHGSDGAPADRVGTLAAWFTIAAAVLDHLLDEGGVRAADLHPWVDPEELLHLLQAAAPTSPLPPCPDRLLFLRICLEQVFHGIRELYLAARPGVHRDRLLEEITICLRRMTTAELNSPRLCFGSPLPLDEIHEELRVINALVVWFVGYLGLFTSPEPPRALLEGLRRACTALGELGWILDALSDIRVDLEAGCWNRVWLELARSRGWTEVPQFVGGADEALQLLEASTVPDELLGRLETLVHELEGDAALPIAAAARLGLVSRMLIWSFLATAEPVDRATA